MIPNTQNLSSNKMGIKYTFFFCFIFSLFLFPQENALASKFNISLPRNNLGLVGYWTFDGKDTPWTSSTAATTLDKSGNNNTGTLTNMSQATSIVPGVAGQALTFDGSNDFVSTPSTSTYNTSVGTVSLWVKINAQITVNNTYYTFASTVGNSETFGWKFEYLKDPGDSQLKLQLRKWTPEVAPKTNYTLNVGQWTHLVATWDGTNVRIYSNGSLYDTLAAASPSSGSDILCLGADSRSDCSGQVLNGSLDDVRIYNRALSTTEITGLYNLGKPTNRAISVSPTQGLTSGLVGYWTFDGKDTPWTNATTGTTKDKSGNNNTSTLTAMSQATSTAPGVTGQGLTFDGVDDDISIADANSLDLSTAGTVAFWYKKSASAKEMAITKWTTSGNQKSYVLQNDNDNKIYWNVSGTGADIIYFTSTSTYIDTDWHHLVGVYNGTTLTVYRDGASVAGSITGSVPASIFNSTSAVKTSYDGANFNTGSMDDVRIYNRALSTTEVTKLYNLGKPRISVSPTTSLTSGLVGYWTFDGKDTPWTSATEATTKDKSGNNNTGTLTAMSQATAPKPGIHGQALNFDGVNDYISIPLNLSGTNVVTTSFWFNAPEFANVNERLLEFTTDADSNVGSFNFFSQWDLAGGYNLLLIKGNVGVDQPYYTRPSAGVWHHYVIIYDFGQSSGNEIKFYIDNVLQTVAGRNNGPTENTGSFVNSTLYLMSRAGTTTFDDGLLDDVRIYNRALSAAEISQLYNAGR